MKYRFLITLLLIVSLMACSKEEVSNQVDSNNGGTETNKAANRKTTGASANDLLSSSTFKSMIIELVYVDGFEPTQTAINNLKSFIEARTFKPNGITIEKRSIAPTGKLKYSIEDIISIEDSNRTKYNTNNQIAIWAFFANGESNKNTENGVVLGTAYRNTSFVIYQETIEDLSNSAFEPDRSVLETTVITHEFGHIFGLTNLGTPMVSNHEDSSHAKHCNDEDCLMYWSAETGDGLSNLIGSNKAPELDAQCIADLQANGGK
ncbi:membrane metalloprotease [Hwangdonia lutea]|uniref:Membrane metalloprotease n=1 Tax=Hwangdonia lutea TaxID=3075823 RepID=A0AA97EKJ6_9FLAO|nr:membrane metalloprotease [Hwangdonia sp. SCSIO 19198]WOD42942.1 membrane metalloprotease [Hwangdonia sp. SCSIO 19198]